MTLSYIKKDYKKGLCFRKISLVGNIKRSFSKKKIWGLSHWQIGPCRKCFDHPSVVTLSTRRTLCTKTWRLMLNMSVFSQFLWREILADYIIYSDIRVWERCKELYASLEMLYISINVCKSATWSGLRPKHQLQRKKCLNQSKSTP